MAAFGIVHFILDRYLGIDVFYSNVAFSFLNLVIIKFDLQEICFNCPDVQDFSYHFSGNVEKAIK